MIIDVRSRPYSEYRPAYMRARKAFLENSPNKPQSNTKLYIQEFGKFIGANVIVSEYFEESDLARVSGIEFNTEADYAWFMLRYS